MAKYEIKDGVGIIPEGTTVIEEFAFEKCAELTSVTIPDTVTEIGEGAFMECTGLTSIVFPKSVKTIGRRAFDGTGLIEVILPKSVKKVDDMAFIDCHSLKSISIMGSLKIPSGFCEDCELL